MAWSKVTTSTCSPPKRSRERSKERAFIVFPDRSMGLCPERPRFELEEKADQIAFRCPHCHETGHACEGPYPCRWRYEHHPFEDIVGADIDPRRADHAHQQLTEERAVTGQLEGFVVTARLGAARETLGKASLNELHRGGVGQEDEAEARVQLLGQAPRELGEDRARFVDGFGDMGAG